MNVTVRSGLEEKSMDICPLGTPMMARKRVTEMLDKHYTSPQRPEMVDDASVRRIVVNSHGTNDRDFDRLFWMVFAAASGGGLVEQLEKLESS